MQRGRRAPPRRGRGARPAALLPLSILPAILAAGGGGAISGRLAFLTCDYPACAAGELRALDLATNASELLWALPAGGAPLDDAYTGNCLLADARTLLLALQFDAAPAQGALVTFDLVARAPRGAALNTSSCVVLLLDPSDAGGARLLCLRILQGGPDGEATQLRHIDRLTGEDRLVATLFPQHATFGEAVVSRGVLYVPMAPLAAGPFFIAAIDPQTGRVLATNGEARAPRARRPSRLPSPRPARRPLPPSPATFPFTLTMVGLVADAPPGGGDGTALSVVRTEDGNGGNVRGFLARVDLATAKATQVGSAELNMTRWTQLNPINALDAAAGVLFLTAFDGGAGNSLHLLGLSTSSGELVYDLEVRNPFADLVFLGS